MRECCTELATPLQQKGLLTLLDYVQNIVVAVVATVVVVHD